MNLASGIVFVDKNMMAEISARSSIFLFRSSSVHLNPRSLAPRSKSCNWHCSIQVELPNVSLGLLSHRRRFMSKYGIAHHHASISNHGIVASSSSDVLLL